MAFAGDVSFAVASLVIFAGDAAVAAALPAVAGAASAAILAKVVADDAASLADAGIVTVDVTIWADAGSELPADPYGVVTMVYLADARRSP